jgi:hypothetical protein
MFAIERGFVRPPRCSCAACTGSFSSNRGMRIDFDAQVVSDALARIAATG